MQSWRNQLCVTTKSSSSIPSQVDLIGALSMTQTDSKVPPCFQKKRAVIDIRDRSSSGCIGLRIRSGSGSISAWYCQASSMISASISSLYPMDSLGCRPEPKRRRSASRLQQTKQLLPRPSNQERLQIFLSRAGEAPDPSLLGILSSFFDDLSVNLLLYIRGTLGGVILDQAATICIAI